MEYLNFCKTCWYFWESLHKEKFCPKCLTENVIHDKEDKELKIINYLFKKIENEIK